MTFGEKLYQLRKSQGLSQEAFAEKLHTSRQAVSKWENDNGYPETEKIILISKIFQVTLDDLLIDDREPGLDHEKILQEKKEGFYVSRETANGFLFYYKRKFLLLASACGIALGCNSVSYTSTEYYFFASSVVPILTTISIMLFLAIVIYIALKQNPYRVLRKKELVFAKEVRKEIQEEFLKMKKMLVGGIALGLLIFVTVGSGWGLPVFEGMKYMDILFWIILSMILSGIGSFITCFCIGIYWSYSILPTGALDSNSSAMLLHTLQIMNREFGATILMVTHDVFSACYCEKILFLSDGKICSELERGNMGKKDYFNRILDMQSKIGGDDIDTE